MENSKDRKKPGISLINSEGKGRNLYDHNLW